MNVFPWWVWALLIAFVGLLAVGIFGDSSRGTGQERSLEQQRRESSKWARVRDVPALVADVRHLDPRRVLLGWLDGRMIVNPVLRSLLVLAPTGAGKTPRVVVPIILGHRGPAIITSVKGDVLQLTSHHRGTQGPVWVFNPLQPSSARWSPLATINDWAGALDAAKSVQECSRVNALSSGDMAFWDSQSRNMLAPLLWLAARKGGTMADVAALTANAEDSLDRVRDDLLRLGDENAFNAWASFCQLNHRTRSSVVATAWNVLESWAHPRAREVVDVRAGEHGSSVFDIDRLLDTEGTLYLVCPAMEQAQLAPIFETLVNAVMLEVERRYHQNQSRPPRLPLLLCLDEAANIAPLRNLDQIASEKAGQGVILVSVWQDDGQLATRYGPDRARTVAANHTAQMYLPGISDHLTLQRVSSQLGPTWVRHSNTNTQYDRDSWSARGRSHSDSMQLVPLASESDLRQLADNEAIVLVGKFKPMRLQLRGWFERAELRRLIPPQVAAYWDNYYGAGKSRAKGLPALRNGRR